jgi:DNA-binding GntR family transcriptional regulator
LLIFFNQMKRTIEGQNLAKEAYLRVRTDILSGKLPLGSPISRRHLAQALGMSVVPITEALQQLESEGLVESWPRVGTRVRVPTLHDVRGHYVVREALESQAARLFAKSASGEERRQILEMGRALDESYRRSGLGGLSSEEHIRLHEEHFRFHMRVAECSGHDALCQAIERHHILTFNWLYDTAANRTKLPNKHHSSLAEVLSRTDPEKADAAMRVHVMYGSEDLLRSFEPRYLMGPGL